MMRRRSLATLAEEGGRRKRASSPTSAPEHAGEEASLRLLQEPQRQTLAEEARDGIIVGQRSVALVIENDGNAGIGSGKDVRRLRHHAYHIEPQDLLHVVHAHHLSARDPPRVVSRQQEMFLHAAITLLRTLCLAGEQPEDTVGVADR